MILSFVSAILWSFVETQMVPVAQNDPQRAYMNYWWTLEKPPFITQLQKQRMMLEELFEKSGEGSRAKRKQKPLWSG